MPTIKLTLPLPPSANRYWRQARGHMHVSAEAKAYKDQVAWLARAQGVDNPMVGNVGYRVTIYRKRKVGDLDNRLKCLGDALNGVLWNDDSQVVYIEARRADDKDNPRVELEAWREE